MKFRDYLPSHQLPELTPDNMKKIRLFLWWSADHPIVVDNKLLQEEIDFLEGAIARKFDKLFWNQNLQLRELQRDIFSELYSRLNRGNNEESKRYIRWLIRRMDKFFQQIKKENEAFYLSEIPSEEVLDYSKNNSQDTLL